MPMPSRVFLLLGLLLPAAIGSAAPLEAALQPLHVLNRLAFGPTPGDVERVQRLGVAAYIEQQLTPQSIDLPSSLQTKLAPFSTLSMDPVALFRAYAPPRPGRGEKPDREALRAARARARIIIEEASAARLARAIESPRQLEEVMVDFWFNHFNVFAGKGLDHLWIGAYEREAIRPFVFGRFRELLGATARHPAMLFYLDNWQNTAPDSRGARGRFKGLNENYARELMELHTLGVDGGYRQQDVVALARILTGWGFARPGGRGPRRDGGFYFDASRHDGSDKEFLGRSIRGGGVEEGEQALDLLARHPSTARHLGYKLAQYFVADEPPAALVDRLAGRFAETDGDIRAVLRELFAAPEFWDRRYYHAKFKTPYQYVISAIRASGVPVDNYRVLRAALLQQGMPLYLCRTPDGYKNTQDAWLNPDAMMRRIGFATALGSGRLPLDSAIPPMQEARGATPLDGGKLIETGGGLFSQHTQTTVRDAVPALQAALVLGGPEFMRR